MTAKIYPLRGKKGAFAEATASFDARRIARVTIPRCWVDVPHAVFVGNFPVARTNVFGHTDAVQEILSFLSGILVPPSGSWSVELVRLNPDELMSLPEYSPEQIEELLRPILGDLADVPLRAIVEAEGA